MNLASVQTFVRSRIELRTALAFLAAVAGIWGFVALSGEVLEGDTQGLDTEIFLLFQNPDNPNDPLGPHWLEVLGRDMTALGGTGVLIMITAFTSMYLLMQGKRRTAFIVIAAIASGFVASQLLKWGFSRPRPDLVPHGTYVYSASFPSGHAMMSAVTYLTVAILTARVEEKFRLRLFFLLSASVLTLLVGISRIYLGVHWPSDVLAGWTLGAAWAIGWWFVARWIDNSSTRQRPAAT